MGVLVAIYWTTAFWVALTTPLYGDVPSESDPMELIRASGFLVGTPIYYQLVAPFTSSFEIAVAIFVGAAIGLGAVSWLISHFIRSGLIRWANSKRPQ